MIAVIKLPEGKAAHSDLGVDLNTMSLQYPDREHLGFQVGWCRESFSFTMHHVCDSIVVKRGHALVDIHGIVKQYRGRSVEDFKLPPEPDNAVDSQIRRFLNIALLTTRLAMNPSVGAEFGRNKIATLSTRCRRQPTNSIATDVDDRGVDAQEIDFDYGMNLIKDVHLTGDRYFNEYDHDILPVGSLTNIPSHWFASRSVTSFVTYLIRMWYYIRDLKYKPCVSLSGRGVTNVVPKFKAMFPDQPYEITGPYCHWVNAAKGVILPSFMLKHGRAHFWSFFYLLMEAATVPGRKEEIAKLLTSHTQSNGFRSFLDAAVFGSDDHWGTKFIYRLLTREGVTGLYDIKVRS